MSYPANRKKTILATMLKAWNATVVAAANSNNAYKIKKSSQTC